MNLHTDAVQVVATYDKAALVEAFRGVDAVVATVGLQGLKSQLLFVDAAIKAGVKRFIPSEFGSDLGNENARRFGVYAEKMQVKNYLEQKVEEGKIEWTALSNGGFLYWCLEVGFLGPNLKDETATLFDGGKEKVSFTMLEDVGKAVVGILQHPEETKNKLVYVRSALVTIEQIIDITKKILGRTLKRTVARTENVERGANEKIAKGDFSGFVDQIVRILYGPIFGSDFTGRTSNELFGIKELDQGGIEAVVKKIYNS